ncbi:MAG: hypothetical protein M1831_003045 [Alyxoria varia]|nr:MAG: hypothetical protein M1831_003045 [Alyxoria varia]
MAQPMPAACLYQETRVNLDPASPDHLVDILLPAHGSSSFSSRASPKRRRVQTVFDSDETAFTQHNLASESSVHYRPTTKGDAPAPWPRSVLWRVLENGTLLELQGVDLYEESSETEGELLTLRFTFPSPICVGCVAISEIHRNGPSGGVIVFALTQQGELFELTLKNEAFVRTRFLETESTGNTRWCRTFAPSGLNFRSPHRLFAASDAELWISLTDGSLARLSRLTGAGPPWRETFFTEGGWRASMKGFLTWKSQSVRRDDGESLSAKTASSVLTSPDGSHLWTVCLDHTLRAWNIAEGNVTITKDLLDEDREFQKPYPNPISPGATKLFQIIPSKSNEKYTIITFSPAHRQFKFWSVNSINQDGGILDAYPELNLSPPLEDVLQDNVWTIESFHINPPRPRKRSNWELWLLARAGNRTEVVQKTLNLNISGRKFKDEWKRNWSKCHHGFAVTDELRKSLEFPSDSDLALDSDSPAIAERWASFIFHPARFSTPVIVAAFELYASRTSSHSRLGKQTTSSRKALREWAIECVGSHVRVPHDTHGVPSFAEYIKEIQSEWRTLYGVLENLQKQREKAFHLALDPHDDLPRLVMADQLSVIRACCELEIVKLNEEAYLHSGAMANGVIPLERLSDSEQSQFGLILNAARTFRQSVGRNFITRFKSVLVIEILQPTTDSAEDQIDAIYRRSQLGDVVTDEDYDRFIECLKPVGGIEEINDDVFEVFKQLLSEDPTGVQQKRHITTHGARFLVSGAQDTLAMGQEILLDLLFLLIFITMEVEPDDLSRRLHPRKSFNTLASKAKEYWFLGWLTNTPTTLTYEGSGICALQTLFIHEAQNMRSPQELTQMSFLTYWSRAWTFGVDALLYNELSVHVMTVLLTSGESKLALDFLKFMPWSPWTMYLRGRLYLFTRDFEQAVSYFKQAAADLAANFHVTQYDKGPLLRPDERRYFNEGKAAYYHHVMALFEEAKATTFVADFAELALVSLDEENPKDVDLRKHLLSRLSSACLGTSQFMRAFDAIEKLPNDALRKSLLRTLLERINSTSQTSTLLSLDFPPDLAEQADEYLSVFCRSRTATQRGDHTTIAPHKLLYAWRIRQNNYRGAAVGLWERIQRIRLEQREGLRGADIDEEVGESYLALINCLCLVDESMAWMLVHPITSLQEGVPPSEKLGKRMVVTLQDVRREWQEELDRMADLAAGRVPLGLEGMDLDTRGANGMGAYRGNMPNQVGAMEVDVFSG